MLELFAWSSTGHLTITQAAVLLAIGAIKAVSRPGLMQKLGKMYDKLSSFQEGIISTPLNAVGNAIKGTFGSDLAAVTSGDAADFGRTTAKDASSRWKEIGLGWSAKSDEDKLRYLMYPLPYQVVKVDLHAGNMPKVGEKLDKQGQVRHFMRSTESVSAKEAFDASMKWVKEHATTAYTKIKAGVEKAGDRIDLLNSAVSSYQSGLSKLADAVHTLEDSFAQGHVRRQGGNTNIIREVNRWDEANKEGDPATGKLGHHDFDDPNNPANKQFVQAATDTTTELIACVFTNLDQPDDVFAAALTQLLSVRFVYTPDGP